MPAHTRRGSLSRCSKLFLFVTLGVTCVATGSHATTYNLTTFADDAVINGNCTLREAIDAATRNVAVDQCPAGTAVDTIQLQAGTYTFNQGEYFSNATGVDLTISGQGSGVTTVSMGFQNRFLHYDKPGGGGGNHITLDAFSVVTGSVTGTVATPANGGAIRVRQTSLTLNEMTFSLNRTVTNGDGGAVSFESVNPVDDTTLVVVGTVFDTNVAARLGGGLSVDSQRTELEITASRFDSNAAVSGGGASLIFDGNGSLVTSEFVDNTSSSSGAGARLSARGSSIQDVVIRGCVFRDNVTSLAGLVDNVFGSGLQGNTTEADVIVDASRFFGNRTTSTQANRDVEQLGFQVRGVDGTILLTDTIIANSDAMAFHLELQEVVEHPDTDTPLGGVGVRVSHVTVTGNAGAGRFDYERIPDTFAFVEYLLLHDNDAGAFEYNGQDGFLVTNEIVEYADPLFVDPANEDFRLQAGSPALDVSNVSNVTNPFDHDGVMRPQGSGRDVGACERVAGSSDLPFFDGFESGDTNAWTMTVP